MDEGEIEITKEMIDNKEVDYVYWSDEPGDYNYYVSIMHSFMNALKKWNLTIEYGYYKEHEHEQDNWYMRIVPIGYSKLKLQ